MQTPLSYPASALSLRGGPRQLAPDHRLAFVPVQPDGAHLDEVRYVGDVFAGAEPSWINDFDL